MFTIRKAFKIEMAHQLEKGKCYTKACSATVHGHSYVIEVFLTAEQLDSNGMVVDFGQLKEIIGPYIEQWDHALVLSAQTARLYGKKFLSMNKKVVITKYNPTAEEMARDIHNRISEQLTWPPSSIKVRVHETATGWAEYTEQI